MLPQDDLTTSEHFRDQRHNKHFALCYNKVMPFAMFATDNWIFIWLALSKLRFILWARERCLTAPLRKGGLGQTHTLSTPATLSPGAEKGVHRTIPMGPAGHWQFAPLLWADVPLYSSICFFPGELKLSGESTQLTGGHMDRKAVQHSITSATSGWHSCTTHHASHQCSSTDLTLPSPHLMATPASASNTPL